MGEALTLPLRHRALPTGLCLTTSSSGRFAYTNPAAAERLAGAQLTRVDWAGLRRAGLAYDQAGDLAHLAHLRDLAVRASTPTQLDYLILVPTLRCDLSCSYCQVSRAAEGATGYDWTDATLGAVLDIIDGLETGTLKVEFQGGEPTLRLDLIRAVIDRCQRFARRQFVICTNLSRLDDDLLDLLAHPDVLVSTSLDGDRETHRRNRTGSVEVDERFASNLDRVLSLFGPAKVAALPTIDPLSPPPVDSIIEAYADRRLLSIPLRPITYHGFARKRHAEVQDAASAWQCYHRSFVERLIALNWIDRSRVLEESHLSLCLRRIFRPGADRHVDLRSPNPIGKDYVVIDYDGTVYPTDEARMLARSGVIDLAIGDVHTGWNTEARARLDQHSTNEGDPTCERCTYQPFCGRDIVDDIARYGRIDLPRHETDFCRRHLYMFDLAFELLGSDDPAIQYSLARWLGLRGDSVPGMVTLT